MKCEKVPWCCWLGKTSREREDFPAGARGEGRGKARVGNRSYPGSRQVCDHGKPLASSAFLVPGTSCLFWFGMVFALLF